MQLVLMVNKLLLVVVGLFFHFNLTVSPLELQKVGNYKVRILF